jgi:hypothetical protein
MTNKLEHSVSSKTFQPGLKFQVRPGAYHRGDELKGYSTRLGSDFTHEYKARIERPAEYKGATTFCITTLSIMTLSSTGLFGTLSSTGLFGTLSINDILHK